MSLPPIIEQNPQLHRWLQFADDGTVVVRTGKVEIGQGIKTAIAMIAAEELDVDLDQIRIQTADTEITPNEYITAGSMSVEHSGSAVRVASATARAKLMDLAADALGVPAASLEVNRGIITSTLTNEQSDYWTLLGGRPVAGNIVDPPVTKSPRHYRTVGHRAERVDLPAKFRGDPAFVQDLRLPGMVHGRLVKPPFMTAELTHCPTNFAYPGMLTLVRDGSFLGVVAEREEAAVAAAERLAGLCRWRTFPVVPGMGEMEAYLREKVTVSYPVIDGAPVDAEPAAPAPPDTTSKTLTATYFRPYQAHGSIGPSAAVAQLVDGKLTVHSHSQGVELLKRALADALGMAHDAVHVIHVEGAGCYGHNGADDVALDAALLAMTAAPRPVIVKWTRADEHAFEPYAPATVIDMSAHLDAEGRVVGWGHQAYGFTHMGRPRPSPGHTNLQPAWWRERSIPPVPRQPVMAAEAGIHRNMEPIYDFTDQHLVKHFVADGPLRSSSTRSLGAFANVFAIESFMDELALAAGRQPLTFRLDHLTDDRARNVLELLHDRAPAPLEEQRTGRGLALARYKNQQTYVAIIVDVQVSDDGAVSLRRAYIAADAGLVVDPDGLCNQLEGGFIQAASWSLREQVTWDADGVTSRDWQTYPILTFSEIPEVHTFLVDRREHPALGAGEASTGPTPAAIANAIYDAVGVRVRTIPFLPEQVRRAAAQ